MSEAVPESVLIVEVDPPFGEWDRPASETGWQRFWARAAVLARLWWSQGGLFLAVIGALGLFGSVIIWETALRSTHPVAATVAEFSHILCAGTIVAYFSWRWRRKCVSMVQESTRTSFPDALKSVASGPFPHEQLPRLARHAHRIGYVGRALLVVRRGCGVVPPAIEVPFEPRVLSEFDTGFSEFRQSVVSEMISTAREPARRWPLRGRASRFRVGLLLLGVYVMLPVSLLVLRGLLKHDLLTALWWTAQLLGGGLVLVGAVVALVHIVLTIQRNVPWWRPDSVSGRWLLLNGGIAIIDKALPKAAPIKLMERSKCTLLALVDSLASMRTPFIVRVLITDGDTVTLRWLSQVEFDMLLRAWLSPIPPPPIEQFSDLAESLGA